MARAVNTAVIFTFIPWKNAMVKLRNKHNCQSWLFYQKVDKIQMDLHRSNNSRKNWSFHWNTFQMICAYIIPESTVQTPGTRYGVCRYVNASLTTNTPYPPFNLYKMDGQVCKFGLATNLLLFHCFLFWSNVLYGVYDGTQKETIQEMVVVIYHFCQTVCFLQLFFCPHSFLICSMTVMFQVMANQSTLCLSKTLSINIDFYI